MEEKKKAPMQGSRIVRKLHRGISGMVTCSLSDIQAPACTPRRNTSSSLRVYRSVHSPRPLSSLTWYVAIDGSSPSSSFLMSILRAMSASLAIATTAVTRSHEIGCPEQAVGSVSENQRTMVWRTNRAERVRLVPCRYGEQATVDDMPGIGKRYCIAGAGLKYAAFLELFGTRKHVTAEFLEILAELRTPEGEHV